MFLEIVWIIYNLVNLDKPNDFYVSMIICYGYENYVKMKLKKRN